MHLGLLALGVQADDEVITSPNSFLATAEAISYCGAVPVFVDIDPANGNLDPRLIERAITPRTRVILPVHIYGRPADMDPIREIAVRHNLRVLEDAAQAHGASYRGKRAGGLAHAAAFSFYPTKNLAATVKGLHRTDDVEIAKFARAARSMDRRRATSTRFIGYNYRMQGFPGRCAEDQVSGRLFAWTSQRQEIPREYRRLLANARLEIPVDDPRDECVYHQFVIYTDNRNATVSQLAERDIETVVHYPRPIHLQPAYSSLGLPPGTFPCAERACERVLSLPLHPGLTSEQIAYVANAVREIVGEK